LSLTYLLRHLSSIHTARSAARRRAALRCAAPRDAAQRGAAPRDAAQRRAPLRSIALLCRQFIYANRMQM